MRNVLIVGVVASLLAGVLARADEPIGFMTQRLSTTFWSEGATVGDFNHDGKMDIMAGPYWWEGPDFKIKHEVYEPKKGGWDGAKEYSDNFLAFTWDVNGDGWPDVVVAGFPTKDARWYENPKGADQHWAAHLMMDKEVNSESPIWADLFKENKGVLVTTVEKKIGYLAPGEDVTKPWAFHAISDREAYGHFTHGTGVGDVNGDGRLDILLHDGWYEQPAKPEDRVKPWTFHPADFGGGGAQMYVYDVDGDLRPDVITSLQAHQYGLAWFKQKPDGTFERHLITGTPTEKGETGVMLTQPHAIALADVDGDGLLDIVTGKRRFAHGDHGDVDPLGKPVTYWFKLSRDGGGNANYTAHLIDDNTGVGTQVVAEDINGDGRIDVLVGNKMGTTILLQGGAQNREHAMRKVLVFSMTKGFHHSSIPLALRTVSDMGQKSGEFTAVVSDDVENFEPERIKAFNAVVFLNTTGEIPFSAREKEALEEYVKSGHGFVGVHSATDTLYQWPAYGQMIGGYFDGHPWGADVTETLRGEAKSPITEMFGDSVQLTEEIYQLRAFDRAAVSVQLSLDTMKTPMNRPGIKRTDGDFPVSWIKMFGKGHVFYTSLGHNESTWGREDFQKHLLAGIKFALGDTEIDTKSHAMPAK